ncbi:MAG: two-component system CheB/CheR fusion protein [Oleiphilaceae bacterium]|jgi:two-component system CheB/CheR fusion protein
MTTKNLIVGIGASAGGLEALETFFKSMPDNSGISFVVIVHLDPHHSSILPELLQRTTNLNVIAITNDTKVLPNTVYVIPPNHNIAIFNRKLQLLSFPEPRTGNLPIDVFFSSLAEDQGENAVAIILSGTGSDGSQGLKEIKAQNGLVISQDESSAKYNGMPRNAIATGMVDCVLSPDKMPEKLIQYLNQIKNFGLISDGGKTDKFLDALKQIILLIHRNTGHDFSLYKKNTLFRRIERRMYIHQLNNIDDYLHFLQYNEDEITTLFKELLIGVTSFFRDKEAFDLLASSVLPNMLEGKPDDYTIRIWVSACSSGEEAYSIAICVKEYLNTVNRKLNIQIFATDIDEKAISIARSALYSENALVNVDDTIRNRYFIKENGRYRIIKAIREILIFANQSMIKDPPFTRLDLLSCRNVLIYFSAELQKKLFPIFHYSLKENGILFLGSSETTGQFNEYFEILNKKWKFYIRKSNQKKSITKFALSSPVKANGRMLNTTPTSPASSNSDSENMLKLVEMVLKKSEAAPCVVIDHDKNILYVHGRLGRYLEPAQGHSRNNLLEMARTVSLKNELTNCIHKAEVKHFDIVKIISYEEMDGGTSTFTLKVIPLENVASFKKIKMVVFDHTHQQISGESLDLSLNQSPISTDIVNLQQQLTTSRENLEITIQELETSNEELMSSNEELQSTNEELQSTNEELETSKEELQSLNEESTTVNAELQSRMDELSQTNDDIKNLLDSTKVATIFLDTQLKIRRFTPTMTNIINLLPTDIGRPIDHFSSNLCDVKLTDYARKVLTTLDKIDLEVKDNAGNYYNMRLLPYRTSNNVIDGVVIAFNSMTERQQEENSVQESEQRYKSLFDYSPFAILEIDLSMVVTYINNHKLTTSTAIKKRFANFPHEKELIISQFKLLNMNNSALALLNSGNEDLVIEQFPERLMSTDEIIAKLLVFVSKRKTRISLPSSLARNKENDLRYVMTWIVPTVNSELNYSNAILTIS